MKIQLNKGQNIFFTSDTHFSHSNLVSGTTQWKDADAKTRKFDTLEEHDEMLIKNINNKVGVEDILFHLGDWSFGGDENIMKFKKRLHCQNIHLILGNHDHHIENNKDGIQGAFKSVNQYLELDISVPSLIKNQGNARYKCILMHYPVVSWNHMARGAMHLHGHTHLPNHLKVMPGKGFDVGMDGNVDFEPYSLDEVVRILDKQPIKSMFTFDHHSKEYTKGFK